MKVGRPQNLQNVRNKDKKNDAMERRVANQSKTNPKAFFSYINSAKKTRAKIGPLKDENGSIVAESKKQAEILNGFYASVFTQSTTDPPTKERTTLKRKNDIEINKEKVIKMIEGLKKNSAPGPDGILNRIMIELKEELAHPLAILYRKSMDEGQIPNEWRLSHVTPIFKSGSRMEPGNYCPVNLTSNPCKGMERIVNGELVTYLDDGITTYSQYGFRKGRSCQSNLIDFLETTTKWIDEGRTFDIIYLDFSKAFDKVCHKRLKTKLEAAGIEGRLKDWIKDWLEGRMQRLVVDGEVSKWAEVISSVIQGSVLGGTLFNLYINDIDDVIKSLIWKFADDTKAARLVETQEDANEFQADIDRMCEWAQKVGDEI